MIAYLEPTRMIRSAGVATVVTIMDRSGWDANTDNIVVVDPVAEHMLWIPRDLYCDCLKNRINQAFRIGAHDELLAALGEHGWDVRHSLCLQREAAEAALATIIVTVPIAQPMIFWYPVEPRRPIEEGRKLIRFDPPSEILTGERIHQWIGARYQPQGPSTDFDRMARQQVLVRQMLIDGFDFASFLHNRTQVSLSDDNALVELASVNASWSFNTFTKVRPQVMFGMQVLMRDDGATWDP